MVTYNVSSFLISRKSGTYSLQRNATPLLFVSCPLWLLICSGGRRAGLTESSMRLLLLIDTLSVGGAEYQVVTDANLLSETGVQVTVACFREGPLQERLSSAVRLAHLNQWGQVGHVLAVRRLCQQQEIELIHAHMWAANLVGALAGWSLRIPVIVTEHGLELWRSRKHIWAAKLTYRLASRVYAVCEATRQVRIRREGLDPGRISVLYNCFDLAHISEDREQGESPELRRTLDIPSTSPIVGFLGRLHPVKRLDLLAKVAAVVCKSFPNAVFLLVGDGPERQQTEYLVEREGLSTSFRLVGYQSGVADFLALMDVLLITSEREALSISAIEAAAMGVPSIGFDVGGNAEVIEHGETGFVVPFGDIDAFSERLGELLRDESLRARMAHQARERAWALFSPKVRVSNLLRAYGSCAGDDNL